MLRPGEKVYDENDWQKLIPPVQGHIERDWKSDPYGSFAAPFAESLLVPRTSWSARIKEMREEKSMISDLWIREGIKSLHQQRTSMCWMFAVFQAIMALRVKAGLPNIVPSPAASALPCMNWQDNGGWSTQGCKWLAQHGWNTVEEAGGSQVQFSRSSYTDDIKAKAQKRRVTEFTEVPPRNFDYQMSLALRGIPAAVGYNRLGHAICQLDPVEDAGVFGLRLVDNYGDANWTDENGMYVMTERLAIADDCVAPRVIIPTMV